MNMLKQTISLTNAQLLSMGVLTLACLVVALLAVACGSESAGPGLTVQESTVQESTVLESTVLEPNLQAAEVERALGRARKSADALGDRLQAALGAQLQAGAPAAAIDVCSGLAPTAADALSRDGIQIKRTSQRYRNPGNAPDSWELAGLVRLEESLASGQGPKEIYEIDEGQRELRYLRPIVAGPPCLQCHGTVETLDPAVRERLALRYPEDKATGFSAGDLRGAFSVKVQMESGSKD